MGLVTKIKKASWVVGRTFVAIGKKVCWLGRKFREIF